MPTHIQELASVAFANLDDLISWDADGIQLKEGLRKMTPDQRAVFFVEDIVEEDGTESTTVTIPGKLEALGKLLEILSAARDRQRSPR